MLLPAPLRASKLPESAALAFSALAREDLDREEETGAMPLAAHRGRNFKMETLSPNETANGIIPAAEKAKQELLVPGGCSAVGRVLPFHPGLFAHRFQRNLETDRRIPLEVGTADANATTNQQQTTANKVTILPTTHSSFNFVERECRLVGLDGSRKLFRICLWQEK